MDEITQGESIKWKKGERAKNIRGILTFCSLKEDEKANRIERRGKEMGGKKGEKGRESINHDGIIGDNRSWFYCFISDQRITFIDYTNCN